MSRNNLPGRTSRPTRLYTRHGSGTRRLVDAPAMKPLALLFMALAAFGGAGFATAQSGADLVRSKGCMNCHAPDTRKVGPSFKELTAKFRGDPAAVERLAATLKAGRTHPKIAASDAELKALAGFVVLGK